MSAIAPIVMKLADVKKLKVVELRVKLKERGLDTKGLKAELVARLWSAIEHQFADLAPSVGGDGSSVIEGMHNVDMEERHEHEPELFKEDIQQGETVAIEVSNVSIGPSRESNSAIISADDGNVIVTAESCQVGVDCHASSGRTVKFDAQQKSTRLISPGLTSALVNGSQECHLTISDEVSHLGTAKMPVDDTIEPGNNKCHVAEQEDKSPISSPFLLMHAESSGTEVHHLQLSVDTSKFTAQALLAGLSLLEFLKLCCVLKVALLCSSELLITANVFFFKSHVNPLTHWQH